jgi:2-iminobutanoate/2-iminopropanoate deaminase
MIKFISTELAAKPLGHYSQATVHNGTIYVATQLGIVPGKPIVVGSIQEQTEAALNNIREILKAAGSDLDKVLRVTVYVADIQFWDEVNAVYIQFFGKHKPARGVIPCKTLHKGFQVAFDVIAAV